MRAFEKRPVSTPASPIAASSQEDTDYSPGGSSSSAESFRGGPPDKARSHVAAVVNMHVFLWFHKKCCVLQLHVLSPAVVNMHVFFWFHKKCCVLQLHVLSPLWKVFAYDKTFKRVTCGCDSPSGGICGRQYAFVVGGTTTQLWRHLKNDWAIAVWFSFYMMQQHMMQLVVWCNGMMACILLPFIGLNFCFLLL